MKNKVGLWVDSRNAILVYIAESEIGIKTIKSNLFKTSGLNEEPASSNTFEKNGAAKDDLREKTLKDLKEKYYEKIFFGVKNAESVLIFGPGGTKSELKTYIESKGTGRLIIGVETVDRMSDRQIIEKVSNYFRNNYIPPVAV